MPETPERPTTRRGLFRSAGRTLAAIGMIAGAAVLTRRPHRNTASETCINRSLCGRCAAFDTCRLPAALSAKQAQETR